MLTISVGIPFCRLEEHETIIVALFLPIFSHRECRGLWNLIGSELAVGSPISLEIEHNREWEGIRTSLLGGDIQKVSEETSRSSGDIL